MDSFVVQYLPKQADLAEVCAWLNTFPIDFSSYFAAIFNSQIDGTVVYSQSISEILNSLSVVSKEHAALLEEGISQLRDKYSDGKRPSSAVTVSSSASARSSRTSDSILRLPSIDYGASSPSDRPGSTSAPDRSPQPPSPCAFDDDEIAESRDLLTELRSMRVQDKGTAPPAATISQILFAPTDSIGWTVAKEGYLRLRASRRGLRRSFVPKLYWFVLKQSPTTPQARLECYKGRVFKTAADIVGASITPLPDGTILLRSGETFWTLTSEGLEESSKWTVALQLAACAIPSTDAQLAKGAKKSPISTPVRSAALNPPSTDIWGSVARAKDYHISPQIITAGVDMRRVSSDGTPSKKTMAQSSAQPGLLAPRSLSASAATSTCPRRPLSG